MTTDTIHNPTHYTQHGMQCIELTQHLNFCLGNAVKYIWRHQDKNGLEDLHKARWYLKRQQTEKPLIDTLTDELWTDIADRLSACQFEDTQERLIRTIWAAAWETDFADSYIDTALTLLGDMIEEHTP